MFNWCAVFPARSLPEVAYVYLLRKDIYGELYGHFHPSWENTYQVTRIAWIVYTSHRRLVLSVAHKTLPLKQLTASSDVPWCVLRPRYSYFQLIS